MEDNPSCPFCPALGSHEAYSANDLDAKQRFKLEFNLGNCKTTRDRNEALDFLLKRDFPDFSFEDGQQEKVLFTPPHFLHQRPDLPSTSRPEFQLVKEAMLPDSLANMKSEDFEKLVFDSFKRYLEKSLDQGQRNVTVIQGWKRNWTTLQLKLAPGAGRGDEHDLIIVDGNRKLLILFEAKMSISQLGTIEKATEQLKMQTEYFRKYHGHVLTPDWKIITVIPFLNRGSTFRCEDCSNYLLDFTDENSVQDFWMFLESKQILECSNGQPDGSYKKLVGRIVGFSASNPLFVSTKAKYRSAVKKALTNDEVPISASHPVKSSKKPAGKEYPVTRDESGIERVIFFASPEQRDALANENNHHMVFRGEPGTGKSLLLKVQALHLSKQGSMVAYFIGGDVAWLEKQSEAGFPDIGNYFYDLTKRDFKDTSVEVYQYNPKQNNEMILQTKVDEGYHIFWDEATNQENISNLNTIAKSLREDQYFWIVLSSLEDKWQDGAFASFQLFEPKFCYRNSIEIIDFVKFFVEGIFGQNFLSSYPEKEGNLPTVIMYKSDFKAAVLRALKDYQNDSVLIFGEGLDVALIESEGWKVVEWQDYLDSNESKESNASKLSNTIIVAEFFDDIAGIEVRNVIICSELMNDAIIKGFYESRDSLMFSRFKQIMSRAVSHLTVVMKDFTIRSSLPSIADSQHDLSTSESPADDYMTGFLRYSQAPPHLPSTKITKPRSGLLQDSSRIFTPVLTGSSAALTNAVQQFFPTKMKQKTVSDFVDEAIDSLIPRNLSHSSTTQMMTSVSHAPFMLKYANPMETEKNMRRALDGLQAFSNLIRLNRQA